MCLATALPSGCHGNARNPPPVTFNGFVACPPALLRGVSEEQRRLYQWALEQAAAVVRPSITQRIQVDLLN